MTTALTSIFFTCIAAVSAYFTAPKGKSYGAWRIAALWIFAAALGFLVAQKWVVLCLLGLIAAFLGAGSATRRVYLYIGGLAAIPAAYGLNVPFPGLNYLIGLTYAKVLTLVLLGPIFLKAITAAPPRSLKSIDRMLLVFVLLTGLMSLRDLPFTSMLRALVDQFLLVYLPYIAISRTLTTREDVESALQALFFSIVLLAVIGVISTLKSWNYYIHLSDNISAKFFTDYRNGFLRIGASVGSALLGYLMGVGFVIAIALRAGRALPKIYILLFTGVFALVLFTTGARGGWLAAALTVLAFGVLVKYGKIGRMLLLTALAAGVAAMLVLIFQESDIVSDKYGTINYRAELLRTSVSQLADRPFFGSADFLESSRFAHLRQGEGIIDLVNLYLQISLYYGFTGLGLFAGAHFIALRSGFRMIAAAPRKASESVEYKSARNIMCVLVAMQMGYLGLIATISGVSYIFHYGFIALALLVAMARITAPLAVNVKTINKEADTAPSPAPVAQIANAPVRPLPYGARLVRRP